MFPIAYQDKLLASVNALQQLQTDRLVYARLNIDNWDDYFFFDSTPKTNPQSSEDQPFTYRVFWSIYSKNNPTLNLLVNSFVKDRFVATDSEGTTLGANQLTEDAHLFFLANSDVAGGEYTLQAQLSDGQVPATILKVWQVDFQLTAAFKFPSYFQFKVRGVALPTTQTGNQLYPAPQTGSYSIDIKRNSSGEYDYTQASATVYLLSPAGKDQKVFYYDFTSLTRGYKISFFSRVIGAPQSAKKKTHPYEKDTPEITPTKVVLRSNVNNPSSRLPAKESNHAVFFTADKLLTERSGKVTMFVENEEGQTGELTIYLKAVKKP